MLISTASQSSQEYVFKSAPTASGPTQRMGAIIERSMALWKVINEALATGLFSDEDLSQDVPIQIELQNTPLHMAIAYGKTKLISNLLQLGASLREKNLEDMIPLVYAAHVDKWDIVQIIIEEDSLKECDPKDLGKSLLILLSKKVINLAKIFISKDIPYDPSCRLAPMDYSLLHEAVLNDLPLDICENMIHKGAPLNAQDISGNTPLHLALMQDRNAIASLLAKVGADLTIRDKSNERGRTPISLAGYKKKFACLRSIIEYIPFQSDTSLECGSALLYAVYHKQYLFAQEFMEKLPFVDPNWSFADQNTALHLAIANDGPISLIKGLRFRKANVNAKNKKGETPLHLAVKTDRSDVVSVLLKAGANLTIRNNSDDTFYGVKGQTPIFQAGKEKKFDCLRLMVEHAPKNVKDDKNLLFGSALLDTAICKQFLLAQ
jgi:ankyrin repeat protein